MNPINAKEAIQFAIDQEIQATKLYQGLYEKSTNPKSKELFLELRDMEIGHRKNLESFDLASFATRHIEDLTVNLKLTDYLLEQEVRDDLSFQETLVLAANREKKTYDLYIDLANKFQDDAKLHSLFHVLATEELMHKNQIEEIYDEEVLSQN